MNINGNYSDLWKAIIRPHREQYGNAELGTFCSKANYVGDSSMTLEGRTFVREDLTL